MLQSRVISEVSFTFVSIREFMVVSRACFQIQGFIFRLRLYLKWAIPISGFATTMSRANNIRSRCATTWLRTSPSGGYSAAHLPSSPETGLTSHCESDKLSLLSLVRMTLTRNNHCERGLRTWISSYRPSARCLNQMYWWTLICHVNKPCGLFTLARKWISWFNYTVFTTVCWCCVQTAGLIEL